MKIRVAVPTYPLALLLALAVLAAAALILLPSSASARPLVGKDGKIHACYKWKGKKKGAIRVVRSAKVRCKRKWKKVSWHARPAGAPVAVPGPPGPQGEKGLPGVVDTATVEQLEGKISELVDRVETLEGMVGSLCTQAEQLNDQTTALGSTMSSFNTVLSTLLVGFSPVSVPTALPSFSCPAP